MANLPTPSPAALTHSTKLSNHIQQEIARQNGFISFARFMELALYAPGLGYYSAGSHKLGETGDFVTAPEISPLFAACIARQCQQILTALSGGDILEIGAGSGKLAADLLAELERLQTLPDRYFILEISADLRERQQRHLRTSLPHLFDRVVWLNTLPNENFNGVILANEVLDALPVNCFRLLDNKVQERCVTYANNRFEWRITAPHSLEMEEKINFIRSEYTLPDGYEFELNLRLPAWLHSVQTSLKKGVILLLDYGYGRREFYHPERNRGTLMCYYQHHRHDNPFLLLGLQDITTHVDFTSVAECAVACDLQVAGFTTQASFLLACGLLDIAAQRKLSSREHYQQNQAIKLLTLPAQMGELIKAIALNKNFATPLLGFSLHDRRQDL